ncbi:hypothetical protein [Streptomyces sp. A5-4]|uniref:hypothetical protein n=1 Tax=Streptomyces sp. A5-4 TaxID=3384771 RepID=UPI003DA845BB
MRRQREQEAAQERVTPEVEALLAAVRRPPGAGAEAAAEAALVAFRAARDAGTHAVPSGRWWRRRRRDGWRPSRRRGALPLKVVLGSLAATVTLGGVALAARTGAIPAPFGISGGPDGDRPDGGPSSSAPVTPGEQTGYPEVPASLRPPAGGDRTPAGSALPPGSGEDGRRAKEKALCRAYLAARGDGRERKDFERLEAAEGGRKGAEAYCGQLVKRGEQGGQRDPAGKKPPKASKSPKASESPKASKSPKAKETRAGTGKSDAKDEDGGEGKDEAGHKSKHKAKEESKHKAKEKSKEKHREKGPAHPTRDNGPRTPQDDRGRPPGWIKP